MTAVTAQRRPAFFDQLYVRLAAALLIVFALLGFALVAALAMFQSSYQEEITQRSNADLAMYIAREHRAIGSGVLDVGSLGELLPYVNKVNPTVDVYVLDRNGRVLAYSGAQTPLARTQVDLQPVQDFLTRSRPMPIRGTDPRRAGANCVFSAALISDARSSSNLGYVYVVLGQSDAAITAMDSSRGYMWTLIVASVLAGLLFALAAALLLFRSLTGRLQTLTETVEAFRAGGFAHAPLRTERSATTRDEIARLERVFAEMGERMVAQLAHLRSIDDGRRTAVLNASHDLRTPLAALQGYLQTVLVKRDVLPAEQAQQYVQNAYQHAQRLSRLVDQMFELAKLDAPETAPKREPFSLAELASDIGQNYALHAQQRGVTLRVEADPQLPPLHADIAMIERVIENLLENALKFTPAGGRIELRAAVSAAEQTQTLSVTDTGSGIAAEDLPHVFERFYRGQNPQRERSSGLGLAIVKRVLELHGARIDVQSVVGQGTQFVVRFAAAEPIR